MPRAQYFKMLEKEMQRINKAIDMKILRGEQYVKEARDHKLILRKVRYMHRQTFFQKIQDAFSVLMPVR